MEKGPRLEKGSHGFLEQQGGHRLKWWWPAWCPKEIEVPATLHGHQCWTPGIRQDQPHHVRDSLGIHHFYVDPEGRGKETS